MLLQYCTVSLCIGEGWNSEFLATAVTLIMQTCSSGENNQGSVVVKSCFPMCMYHYNSTTIHPLFHLWKVALNQQTIGGTSVYSVKWAGTSHLCDGSAHSSGCVVNGYGCRLSYYYYSVKWDGETGCRWLHTASLICRACVN